MGLRFKAFGGSVELGNWELGIGTWQEIEELFLGAAELVGVFLFFSFTSPFGLVSQLAGRWIMICMTHLRRFRCFFFFFGVTLTVTLTLLVEIRYPF